MRINIEKMNRERIKRGWSPGEFGKKCGKSKPWGYWICGSNGMNHTFKTVLRIAKALDIEDPKDLILS